MVDNQTTSKSAHPKQVCADTKYNAYVSLYNNLDNLIWRNSSILLSVTVLAIGIVGTVGPTDDFVVLGFSSNLSIGIGFLVIALLYGVVTFTMYRMRIHHELVERHLRDLEGSGYFHSRLDSVTRPWISAVHWHIGLFGVFAGIALLFGLHYIFRGDTEMPRIHISAETAASEFGVYANHEQMENGELRFRLMGMDGSGYIRTIAGPVGGWQRSHKHKEVSETYIVEQEWMVAATPEPSTGVPNIQLFREGDIYTTKIEEVHNIYLPAGAVIHTVKHGGSASNSDWHGEPDFDKKTHELSETELLKLAGR